MAPYGRGVWPRVWGSRGFASTAARLCRLARDVGPEREARAGAFGVLEALEPYSSWFACNPKHLGFPLTQTPILLSPNHYRAHSLSCNGRLSCDSRYCRDLGCPGSAKCSTRPEVMQTSVIRLMAAVARWSVEGSMEVRKAQTPQSKGRSIKYRNRP